MKKGFTLIELLLVIAIIGLLSTIALGQFSLARARARDATRLSDIREINNAIQLYMLENNGLPPSPNGNPNCLIPGAVSGCVVADWENNWQSQLGQQLSPYLSTMPTDPCGTNCPALRDTYDSGNPFF